LPAAQGWHAGNIAGEPACVVFPLWTRFVHD
jgi:hypothetical protein